MSAIEMKKLQSRPYVGIRREVPTAEPPAELRTQIFLPVS